MTITIFILVTCFYICAGSDKYGLYSPLDEVNILTSENFTEIVCNKGKTSAWVIQFYNAWCGHCRRFAPKFKKLAKNVKGWSNVISLGAVACSDNINTEICRKYDISAYPTLKLFPTYSLPNLTNLQILNIQEPKDIRADMARFVNETIPSKIPSSWPKLKPLKSIEEIWEEAKSEHKHVILIFEEKESTLGVQLIMDYMNTKKVLIRRLLKESVVKYGINKIPSLYVVNKGGTYNHIATGIGVNDDTDRDTFRKSINKLMDNNFSMKKVENAVHNMNIDKGESQENGGGAGDGPDEKKTDNGETKQMQKPQVYLQDLESALHYSFRQEIAIRKQITGEDLTALQNFVSALSKYLPGRDEVKKFLQQVYDWLQTVTTPLSGGDWVYGIDSLQDELVYLPENIEWIGCKGSAAHYRGYPCSMWTLFHTLTVNAYLSDQVEDIKEVLNAIKGYMKFFFGCAECTKNFLQMSSSIGSEVKKKKDIVIWLWSAHNKANKRLHGDLSEDPEHLKIQFPSQDVCPKCYLADSTPWSPSWKKAEVLNFLVEMYRRDNIVKTFLNGRDDRQSLAYRSGIKSGTEQTLDWWEKKQRNQDLKILNNLRMKKQQNFIVKSAEYFKNESIRKHKAKERVRYYPSDKAKWSLSSVDLGMCMAFYVICAVIVLMLYYHFTVRTKHKPICKFLPI